MYEDLPYPPRDPADEAPGEPFAVDSPSTPAAIAHHLRNGDLGALALGRPFRMLVAGGGTGDATVMAAVSFHAAQLAAEIVHLDLSAASIAVARQRLEAHRLGSGVQVSFFRASFLDVRVDDLGGQFDFINCVGVVHHLSSPAEGLRALSALLRPGGGLFLMVYGLLGRTGVYDVQDMWRLSGISRRAFMAGPLQGLLKSLPETNRFAANTRMWSRKVKEGDASTLSDLLAHHCDHAYTIATLLELLAEADLHLLTLADPSKYSIPSGAAAALAPLVAGLSDPWQRAHFGELLRGDVLMHLFWAAPGDAPLQIAGFGPGMALCPAWRFVGYKLELAEGDEERCLLEAPTPSRAQSVPTTCTIYVSNHRYEGLPCAALPALSRADCATDVAASAAELAASAPGLAADVALRLLGELYEGLRRQGQQQVFLVRSPGINFRRQPWRSKRIPRVVVQRDWAALDAAAAAAEVAAAAAEAAEAAAKEL